MNRAAIPQFLSLHNSILAERQALLERLKKIDESLEAMGLNATMRYYGIHTPTGRVRNKLSLRETVHQILSKKALTKEELLDAVLRTGYSFSTNDPLNSLGVVLYGKNSKFKNSHGRFSL